MIIMKSSSSSYISEQQLKNNFGSKFFSTQNILVGIFFNPNNCLSEIVLHYLSVLCSVDGFN